MNECFSGILFKLLDTPLVSLLLLLLYFFVSYESHINACISFVTWGFLERLKLCERHFLKLLLSGCFGLLSFSTRTNFSARFFFFFFNWTLLQS